MVYILIYILTLPLKSLKPLEPLSFQFLEKRFLLARTFGTTGTFKFWKSLKIDLYIDLYIDIISGISETFRTFKFWKTFEKFIHVLIYILILHLKPLEPLEPLSFRFFEKWFLLDRTFRTSIISITSKFWSSLKNWFI